MSRIVRLGTRAAQAAPVDRIGAKAANLARVARLGLPVPPAFVLPVELCAGVAAGDVTTEREVLDGLREGIAYLESATGTRFGDRRRPLLVSVRSGAARSMPGMLDTVLDVGCTTAATRGLVRVTGNPRFAWDCRRRFMESYAATVLGLDPTLLGRALDEAVRLEGEASERELDGEALERTAAAYRDVLARADAVIPDDAMEQLAAAARAVYRSWTSERAQTYRRLEGLDHLSGTAVTVQAMVFGNRSLRSGSGVAFSRDPSTGAASPVIELLFAAQGEDVVSGRRTPDGEQALASLLPEVAAELRQMLARLEHEFGDVQDVEFTIEDGRLWLLQTRAAKRTPRASLRITLDLAHEGLITAEEARRRLDGLDLAALTSTRLVDPGTPAAHGIGAAGGVAVGRAAFDSEAAERLAGTGDTVILVRPETTTADVAGFALSAGIVTAAGGRTAHAALVARQMGKPCVVGCADLAVDGIARNARLRDAVIEEGDWLSLDGDSGAIYLGEREIATEEPGTELAELERARQPA